MLPHHPVCRYPLSTAPLTPANKRFSNALTTAAQSALAATVPLVQSHRPFFVVDSSIGRNACLLGPR